MGPRLWLRIFHVLAILVVLISRALIQYKDVILPNIGNWFVEIRVLRPSYLHNGISYTGKTTSLYWIRALVRCSIKRSCKYLSPWDWDLYHFEIWQVTRQLCHGCQFADDICKCVFSNENIWISNKISLKFLPRGLINNYPALVPIKPWCWRGDKPLSEPMMA